MSYETMSAGFFFFRSSRGADVEGATAAAPAGLRPAPAPLANEANGLRPWGPARVMGPRESGLREMEESAIVKISRT